jgi:alkylation response protein AidB-like acyl-CoA dehydrogenase
VDSGDAELEQLRAQARTWLSRHATPRGAGAREEVDAGATLERGRAWQRLKTADGWSSLTWPTKYGGRGLPVSAQLVWDQEAAHFDVPEEAFIVSTMLAGPTLIDVGSPDQQQQHLPAIQSGKAVWCQLFSEPSAGSDLASVRTRAVRDGDDWVVHGQKVWSSGAHYADWGLLLARTDADAGKHAGLSMLLLEMRSPGVTVRPIRQITGARHFNEVFLDGARVPVSQTLGGVGQGWAVALRVLGHERTGLISRRKVDVTSLLRLLRQATVAGRPALEHEDVRQAVARVCMRAAALEKLNAEMLHAAAAGRDPGQLPNIGKLIGANLLNEMGRLATDVLGTEGWLDAEDAPFGAEWQHAFLDATARRIAGGSDEIQRNIIAERMLGLPRG